jgi:pimeloyl-ACP methyl ester carboxylesterase
MNEVQARTMVMVPGYNEPPEHFDLLRLGTDKVPGFHSYGIDSITFGQCDDTLSERIDRFAEFLDDLKAEGRDFPVVLLGYSLGGLVVRGFLRRFPYRAVEVSHTIMIATPNWGVQTFALPYFHGMLRTPDKAFADMDIYSPFIRWLNGTSGHWERTPRGWSDWVLDTEPWIGPRQTKMLSIAGIIPSRGYDNDGLVWADSATLGSRIPAHYIAGPHANHMNIIGHFDPFIMLSKGFLANDRVWPLTLCAITRFLGAQPRSRVEPSEAA